MKIIKSLSFLTCLLIGSVQAATISFETASYSASLNGIFNLNIVGTDFLNSADGGGVDLSFNRDLINVLSVSINETVWDFGGFGISTGIIDNSLGTVSGIMVNTFSDVGASFTVATIEFRAVGLGVSDLFLNEFSLNPWASGGSKINPDHESSLVTVANAVVPVPAAAWLFGSGLIGLIGVARKKKS